MFAYLNNITVGATTQQEHDLNLDQFLAVVKSHNLTFNESKCICNTDTIQCWTKRLAHFAIFRFFSYIFIKVASNFKFF